MKNNEFNKLLSAYGVTINDIHKHYNIPVRTLKSWRYGERKPPDYVINMLESLLTARNVGGVKPSRIIIDELQKTTHTVKDEKVIRGLLIAQSVVMTVCNELEV